MTAQNNIEKLRTLVTVLTFVLTTSLAWGQMDTVFIKYNNDLLEEKPNYKTDTVIFDSPNARQILFGTTILPMTFNQQMAKNYGLYFDSVALTPCSQQLGKKPDMQNQVVTANQVEDRLTIAIKYWGNCCHSFLCDIEVQNESTINLIIHGYGAMYCDCSCCYGLTYHFSTMKVDSFDKLEFVTINGNEDTKKRLR
jgi:hypothetical protein